MLVASFCASRGDVLVDLASIVDRRSHSCYYQICGDQSKNTSHLSGLSQFENVNAIPWRARFSSLSWSAFPAHRSCAGSDLRPRPDLRSFPQLTLLMCQVTSVLGGLREGLVGDLQQPRAYLRRSEGPAFGHCPPIMAGLSLAWKRRTERGLPVCPNSAILGQGMFGPGRRRAEGFCVRGSGGSCSG